MNDAGLAVSLTFGGRRALGTGFGIPLVVRYLLETCATVERGLRDARPPAVPPRPQPDAARRDRCVRHRVSRARPSAGHPGGAGRDEPPGRRRLARVHDGDPLPRARGSHRLAARRPDDRPRGVRSRFPRAAAAGHGRPRPLRHALYGRVLPTGGTRRLPLARHDLAPVVRRIQARGAAPTPR